MSPAARSPGSPPPATARTCPRPRRPPRRSGRSSRDDGVTGVAAGPGPTGPDDARPPLDELLEDDPADLYENAPCGYLSTLPDGTVVRVNGTFSRARGGGGAGAPAPPRGGRGGRATGCPPAGSRTCSPWVGRSSTRRTWP